MLRTVRVIVLPAAAYVEKFPPRQYAVSRPARQDRVRFYARNYDIWPDTLGGRSFG